YRRRAGRGLCALTPILRGLGATTPGRPRGWVPQPPLSAGTGIFTPITNRLQPGCIPSGRGCGGRGGEGDEMSVQQAGTDIRVLRELEDFPLVEALFGRRSRRFARGGEIPDGPLAYRSAHEPVPLSELERMLVLGAMGGTTGWHFSITRHARYAPHV